MATAQTVQAIKTDIEGNGCSIVPFATVERVLGATYPDDSDFEDAIDTLVAAKEWVTDYHIDWIDCKVTFIGPWTEQHSWE